MRSTNRTRLISVEIRRVLFVLSQNSRRRKHICQLEAAHGEMELREFDLDVALRRNPTLIFVDELARTNVPRSRHTKRYQDVGELLKAGINVQHMESLNDMVAYLTGFY